MKKVLIACFLLIAAFAVKAQQMNFEETVKYINHKIACCSEIKISTIKGTSSGDISWLAGGLYSGPKQINFFDLVPTKEIPGSTRILHSNGIELFKPSVYCIVFHLSDNGKEYLNDFKGQADAERGYKALLHLRSLCTRKKDPFDN